MNVLEQYPSVRKALYLAQWVVNGILGILGIVLAAQGQSPIWFVITGSVFNFVWTYTGLTAQSNTAAVPMHAIDGNPEAAVDDNFNINAPHDEGGFVNSQFALAVVVVLVVLIFLAVFGVIGH